MGFPTRLLWFALVGLLVAACAGVNDLDVAASARPCNTALASFESLAREHGIHLSEPRAVAEFPALGTNRLLASFTDDALTPPQREDWLLRMLEAGKRRRVLLHRMLEQRGTEPPSLSSLDACAAQTLAALPRDADTLARLAEAVQVADDYLLSRRVLGLYPLTALAARSGIRRLHASQRDVFAQPLAQQSVRGELALWRPGMPASAAPQAPVAPRGRDSLGPVLPGSTDRLTSLTRWHAPLWLIDVTGTHDLPGTPYLEAQSRPTVDSRTPVVYTYPTLTRFAGELRLQLNYLVWFSARPARGALDTLAGRLDGVLWRVTLDDSGEALAYDSVHACGCYHWYFATPRVRVRPGLDRYPEPPFVARTLRAARPGQRVMLRLATESHYLQGAEVVDDEAAFPAKAHTYTLRSYSELYSLSSPVGPTPLFARHGLVPGTERGERFYLWPMGIRSAGAMRERGRQATAFLGRRHYDDAHLLDAVFVPADD